jgi:hypothetical protein
MAQDSLTADEVRDRLREQIDRAESFMDEVGRDRTKATNYFHSKPFGTGPGAEEEGRSQVVTSDVKDTVIGILPDLLDVLMGAERIVEFVPNGKEDVEIARQMTDYVVDVVMGLDNQGFKVLYDASMDALVRKSGVIKWYWDDQTTEKTSKHTDLTYPQVDALFSDPDVVSYEVTGEKLVDVPETGAQVPAYDCTVVRRTPKGKIRVEAIPPQEFLISPDARSIDDAEYIGHQRRLSIEEIVALGYDEDEVRQGAGQEANRLQMDEEWRAKRPVGWSSTTVEDSIDPQKTVLTESVVRLPGGAYRRFVSVGSTILDEEDIESRDFTILCPRPEPHSAIGYSLADDTGWIQLVKSSLVRSMLDSFVQSIFPRLRVSEDRIVDMDDVYDTALGAVIRYRGGDPNVVSPMVTPVIATEAIPLIQYFDSVREETTGVTRAANGLDPDALQSATPNAVAGTLDARHKQTKLIARLFAFDLARMFKGIARLAIKHQDKERMVRLRGEWVEIDPRHWDAEMDVQVNLGVGPGTLDARKAAASAVIADHRDIMEKYGLDTPLVNLPLHRKVLARRLEMEGLKNDEDWYLAVDPNYQPPEPDPNEGQDPLIQAQMAAIKAEVEQGQAKLQAEMQQTIAKLQLEGRKAELENDRDRDKDEAEIWLKHRELELKYGTSIDRTELDGLISRQREGLSTRPQ